MKPDWDKYLKRSKDIMLLVGALYAGVITSNKLFGLPARVEANEISIAGIKSELINAKLGMADLSKDISYIKEALQEQKAVNRAILKKLS